MPVAFCIVQRVGPLGPRSLPVHEGLPRRLIKGEDIFPGKNKTRPRDGVLAGAFGFDRDMPSNELEGCPFMKARWGKGSLRGGNPSRASSDRMAARRAVPVATQEATGIDSRDEGGPPQRSFPVLRRYGLTGRAGPR